MRITDPLSARDARQLRWFYFRTAVLLAVFAAGLIGFVAGVGTSDRAGLADAGLATKLYYTVALFVLGGIDLGTPVGGPEWARGLLWFAYFAAPAVTASAVIEGVLRAINPERWRLRGLRDHIIIGGCSRLALLYLQRLRSGGDRSLVVVVDEQPDHKYQATARGHRARWLTGSITRDETLAALDIESAKRVLLLTGDDFANLDAASKMLSTAPQLRDRLAVHVSDLRFKRLMAGAVSAEIFNIYQIAAQQLVETELLPYFERTDFRDIVVFAGFGRLGQTILDELQRRAPNSMDAVIIIDVGAEQQALVFDEQVGFGDHFRRHVIEGDANNLDVWRRAEELADFEQRAPVFLMVSGSDALNLRVAIRLAHRFPAARVVARSYFRSPFAEALSERAGFATFSLAELIHDSLPAAWFE